MKVQSRPLFRWQWTVLVLLFFGLAGITEYLVFQERAKQHNQSMRQVAAAAGQLRAMIESEMNGPLNLSFGLAAYIQASQGQVRDSEFDILLPNLVRQGRHIRNMSIAPDNRISYVYPLLGNESVLGVYYPDIADQWPDIARIIQQRTPQMAGPVNLVQGGVGFIHRIPVYLPDDRYWGIVSTVLNIQSIWQVLQNRASELDVQVALRRNDEQAISTMLLGDPALFNADAILLDLKVADARWQLTAQALESPVLLQGWLVRLICWGICLMLWLLVLSVFVANRRLAQTADAWQQSEAYFRTVLNSVADAIVVVNKAGLIEQVNPAALILFGYQQEQLRGKNYQQLFVEAPQLIPQDAMLELTALHQGGQAILIELNQTYIDHQQQGLTVFLIRDITERKRIEQLKDEFVSTVSHELRTPLTAINGALGLLAAGVVGEVAPAQQQLLDIAQQNGQQLSLLINDILDIEKLAAGKMQLYMQLLDIMPLVLQAKNRNLPLAQQSGVQLKIQSDLTDNIQVLVDEHRLQQVFANLLANAIRFSPEQGLVLLEVRLIGLKVRVSVTDRGPGVPADFVPRLFQKFSQADSSTTRRLSGTGLGLAISKELMERMNGEIGYQPNSPTGACFYIDLPVQ
ncbi:PAS domain S-box protein [Rheinheimera riviphila]|uniref:histidine kinase n=1 Tax=Rheinheimera riviphila TaxID=1834037 RepID=A0A437R5C8_9GAMM|nr:ATP-binding protein [Rheinheimera riviphila]RVU41986.1 PAS domain S-box protein [Rheinheimera riviphila]